MDVKRHAPLLLAALLAGGCSEPPRPPSPNLVIDSSGYTPPAPPPPPAAADSARTPRPEAPDSAPGSAVGRVRMEVAEAVWRSPPALGITMSTVREFGCLGYAIEHDFRRDGSTLTLELTGVHNPSEVCPAAIGPARLNRNLRVEPGRYTLVVRSGTLEDRFALEVTPAFTRLAAERAPRFVQADERVRWRFPPGSFALSCTNVQVAKPVCDDLEGWLARQPGIRRLSFGEGANPYRPERAPRPDEQASFWRYEGAALGRVRRCLSVVEGEIREAVGVSLRVDTWDGQRITAWSTRSYHEPHIPMPARVTAGC